MKDKMLNEFLKIAVFSLPFYFVFYGPLYENSENPRMKALWKYILSGF